MRRTLSRTFVTTLVAWLAATGCIPQPVEWESTVSRTAGAIADGDRLVYDAVSEAPRFVGMWVPAVWPAEPGQCATSRRAVRASTGEAYASWFSARRDSSVVLRVARSDDGGRVWRLAVTADSTDVGRDGCHRPAPALAADSLNGYVHVAYHLVAAEGAGVFFTHSMDRGELFHSPVPIVYGNRPSEAAIASLGNAVAIAFEDPNTRVPQLSLALSRTQGHIFESRIPVSDGIGAVRTPRVALGGTGIALAWTSVPADAGAPGIAWVRGTLVAKREP